MASEVVKSTSLTSLLQTMDCHHGSLHRDDFRRSSTLEIQANSRKQTPSVKRKGHSRLSFACQQQRQRFVRVTFILTLIMVDIALALSMPPRRRPSTNTGKQSCTNDGNTNIRTETWQDNSRYYSRMSPCLGASHRDQRDASKTNNQQDGPEKKHQHQHHHKDAASLIPAQVRIKSHRKTKKSESAPQKSTNHSSSPERGNSKREQRHQTKMRFSTFGNLPDVQWRSISMEHLREHPCFVPLPTPDEISKLDTLEDVRLFRQGSWQWDAVHEGRCTTSQALSALGFLEPQTSKLLEVPRSWNRSGGLSAYTRLRQSALQTLQDMNEVLCCRDHDHQHFRVDLESFFGRPQTVKDRRKWGGQQTIFRESGSFTFAARYKFKVPDEEFDRRKRHVRQGLKSSRFEKQVRMMWGDAQEATSLLTALNYFWNENSDIRIREVGMCGAGLDMNVTGTGGLLIGASPDALIEHPDGTTEVLEVKNHCPFFKSRRPSAVRRSKLKNKETKTFSIRRCNFEAKPVIPQYYVPQIQLEMMSAGSECKSAVMVRQSATAGAVLLRVERNDEWIGEMMYWLRRFQKDFVEQSLVPPDNFFYAKEHCDEYKRYRAFLRQTKEIAESVELLAHIPQVQIQRASAESSGMVSLFLD